VVQLLGLVKLTLPHGFLRELAQDDHGQDKGGQPHLDFRAPLGRNNVRVDELLVPQKSILGAISGT
jgi:hypothetical protein